MSSTASRAGAERLAGSCSTSSRSGAALTSRFGRRLELPGRFDQPDELGTVAWLIVALGLARHRDHAIERRCPLVLGVAQQKAELGDCSREQEVLGGRSLLIKNRMIEEAAGLSIGVLVAELDE